VKELAQLQELARRCEEAGQRGGTCGAARPGRARVQQQEEEEQLRNLQDDGVPCSDCGRFHTGAARPRVKDVGDR
jgi:hypothetical protein